MLECFSLARFKGYSEIGYKIEKLSRTNTLAYFGNEEKKFHVTLTPGAPEAGRN